MLGLGRGKVVSHELNAAADDVQLLKLTVRPGAVVAQSKC